MTRFLLDTSTVSGAIWKQPDPGVRTNAPAEWHGEERARLERGGRAAPFVDGQMIAAIAVTSGIPLVTANPTDFKSFKGLLVLNWTSAL